MTFVIIELCFQFHFQTLRLMKKQNRIGDSESVVESGPTDLLTKYGVGGDSRFIETTAPSTTAQQQQQRTSTDAELATDAGGTGIIASIKRYTTKLNVSQCLYL